MIPKRADAAELPLSKRLKAHTASTHERLDRLIMAARPFDSHAAYAGLLKLQFAFHNDVAAIYEDRALARLIPGLAGLGRFESVRQDLQDLQVAFPDCQALETGNGQAGRGDALGWLYVAEGSNLGAAILFKHAQRLGLSDTYGARHLAPAAEGRADRWRRFTFHLDKALLSNAETESALTAAAAAFARVVELSKRYLG